MQPYEVTVNDLRIGEVEAKNYVEAAFKAARKFFEKANARRETGWCGKPGIFVAFNLDEEPTTAFHLRVAL